jgi:hypothetical protein
VATDATGTPTSLGIRKYNTSADAPSGLGFNGAMDDIDALLVARVTKPGSIASGEVPVWNGSAFVRSSTTNVGPTSLGSGTPDATKFLRGDGSWQVPSSAGLTGITGSAGSTGTVVAGTGWSIVRNSVGNYTVTYTSAFPATPVVFVQTVESVATPTDAIIAGANSSSFTVIIYNSTTGLGSPVDQGFYFLAARVV